MKIDLLFKFSASFDVYVNKISKDVLNKQNLLNFGVDNVYQMCIIKVMLPSSFRVSNPKQPELLHPTLSLLDASSAKSIGNLAAERTPDENIAMVGNDMLKLFIDLFYVSFSIQVYGIVSSTDQSIIIMRGWENWEYCSILHYYA